MEQLNQTLTVYLVKKAPALPKNIKEVLVKIAPWIAIIGVVLSVPGLLTLLDLSSALYTIPYGGYGMMRAGGGFSLAVFFLIATTALQALAIPGLMKRTMAGWSFLYWGVWVNAIYMLLSYQILGLIVGSLISLYFLFQVKSYYK